MITNRHGACPERRKRPGVRYLAIAATSVIAVACRTPHPLDRDATFTDSAGVTIVTYPDQFEQVPIWTLDTVPVLTLGRDVEGPNAFRQIGGAFRFRDGQLIATDSRASEARLFDSLGRFVRIVAREGGGPGEIKNGWGPLRMNGDTAYLIDGTQHRIVVFGPGATPIGTFFWPRGMWTGAAQMVSPTEAVQIAQLPSTCDRPGCRNPFAVIRVSAERPSADTIGVGIGPVVELSGYYESPLPRTAVDVGDRGVWIGDSEFPIVRYFTLDGKYTRSIRWKSSPTRFSDYDRRAHAVEETTGWQVPLNTDEARQAFARNRDAFLDHAGRNVIPQFTKLFAGSNGELWMERDPYPWLPVIPFVIFDSTGRAIGRLRLPRRREIIQIEADFLLIFHTTPDDENLISMFRYRRTK